MIDGINNNDVIKTDIHSTDTHGYTELIFATTHFKHSTFAPRIKNIAEQCIYAFSSKSTYENGEFKQALPDEQNIGVACKVLIQNSIVLWNYLYLSQLLTNSHTDDERLKMVGSIKDGSVMTWGHVN